MRSKKYVFFTHLTVLFSLSELTGEPWFAEPAPDNFYVGGGYRRDDYKYSFQGPQPSATTQAQFEWKCLQSYQVNAEYNHTTYNQWYFRTNGMYGNIVSGKNHHNEYSFEEDDATGEIEKVKYSNTHSNADRGQVWDVSAGFGHMWISDTGRFSFAPLAGYSFHEQRMHILGGVQEYNPLEGIVGRIPDLRGRQYAQWSSPWVGLDMLLRLQCNVTLRFGGEWHFVRYQAHGYWRMDDTFDVHWQDKAFGYGASAFFGFDAELCDGWGVGLFGTYRHYYTRQGHHKLNIKFDTVPGQIFGTIPTLDDVNLNRVTWNSYSISASASYRF